MTAAFIAMAAFAALGTFAILTFMVSVFLGVFELISEQTSDVVSNGALWVAGGCGAAAVVVPGLIAVIA